jgi:RNA polymerase sigma factor (sigma-70 family)
MSPGRGGHLVVHVVRTEEIDDVRFGIHVKSLDRHVVVTDPDAEFVGFFREIEEPMRRFAARVAPAGMDPEDLAAEALARAYARWRRVSTLPYRRAWVFRVAANIACDGSRHKAASLRARGAGALAGTVTRTTVLTIEGGSSMEHVVERESLRLALASLPKRQREAVVLRYLCEVPLKDVADAMSVSVETVKTHCERGLAELRRVLGPSFERTCNA